MAIQAGDAKALRSLLVATAAQPRHLDRLRSTFPDLEVRESAWPPSLGDLAAVDAAVLWSVEPEWLAAAPGLRWIHVGGAGVDTLPPAEIRRHGAILTNSSGVHVPNIPEHVLALMLAFARRLPQLLAAQREHRWRDTETHDEVFELSGQTLLLVGMGDLGLGTGERAAALGMDVIGFRRRADTPVPAFVSRVFGPDGLHVALGQADHVLVSLPLTPATRGLIGAAELAAMRPGAFLYNVGRGPIVDQPALEAALAAGRLGGAGLDVTDPEPLPPESPLWTLENVIITAHTSGASPRYWDRAIEQVVENVRRFRSGEDLVNRVDLDAGY
ncbi:MAG: D-2-hydroxyacid dehydrogenase [Chloroflexia bacterium]|nr:D-2-hydroxyacid dehydrogenase [Chloroflexia bacterium]